MILKFSVQYWNDLKSKSYIASGLTYGKTFTKCLKRVEEYYGDDMIAVELTSDFETEDCTDHILVLEDVEKPDNKVSEHMEAASNSEHAYIN